MRAVPELGPLGTRRSAYVLQVLLSFRTHRCFRGFGVREVLSQVWEEMRGSNGERLVGQPSGPLVVPDQNLGSGGLATPETGGRLRVSSQQTERC